MDLKYIEKLAIAIVVFIGVVIATAYIIGIYNKSVKNNQQKQNNNIVLENINLF